MLPIDIADHRQDRTPELLSSIAEGDALALAEAYHRTSAAAHACGQRLLGDNREVEALLRTAYGALWKEPPEDAPLEAWMRHRVFVEGRAHLQRRGRGAASPSANLLLRDAPGPDPAHDRTERLIASLDDEELRALLLAHDRGIPTADHRSDHAEPALRRALVILGEGDDPGDCALTGVSDWVLGLLHDEEANRVALAAWESPDCAALARSIRRGRRRMEGLPPSPDLGHRVLAYVLADGARIPREASTHPAIAPTPPTGRETDGEDRGPASPRAEPAGVGAPESVLDGPLEEPTPEAALGDHAPSVLDRWVSDTASPMRGNGDAQPGPHPRQDPAAEDASAPEEPLSPPRTGAPPVTDHELPAAQAQPTGEREGASTASFAAAEEEPPGSPPLDDGGAFTHHEPPSDDRENLRFADFASESAFDDRSKGSRTLKLLLMTVGALMLLAAGAFAGLLLVRVVLG